MKPRKWTREDLDSAVTKSRSLRHVIQILGLQPAGGNYEQIKKYLKLYEIDTNHFTGKAWSKGLGGVGKVRVELKEILTDNSNFQSHKLKRRLFFEGLKKPKCESCGWDKRASDGRLPLELDHINGNRHDNRLVNLRILCPNCHSLQPTHRGRNKKVG
jgi:hypothetical protein